MQLNRILKFVIAAIFILLGGYHLINAQTIQYDLISCRISNWVFSPLLYYLLVSLEMSFGVLLLFKKSSKFIDILLIIYLAIISVSTIISGIKTSFIVHYNYLGNALLPFTLTVLIISSKKILNPTKAKKWISILSFVIFIGVAFVFNPIYQEDYAIITTPTHTDSKITDDLETFLTENDLLLKQKNLLVSFLSPSCPSCIETAKKIYVSQFRKSKTNALFIFSDTEDNIRIFISFFHLEGIKYLNISKGKFNYFSDSRTPCSYFLKNKKVVNRWFGYHLNYIELDKIF